MEPSYLHCETSILLIDQGVETGGTLPRLNIPLDQNAITLLNGTIGAADFRSIVVHQSTNEYAPRQLFHSTGPPNQTIIAPLAVSSFSVEAVYWYLNMDVRPYLFVMPKLKPLIGIFLPAADPQKFAR